MTIRHETPVSSAIAELIYDDEMEGMEEPEEAALLEGGVGRLEITFTDGRSYVIDNFPEEELNRWLDAPSVGVYFNYFIRGNY